MTFEHPGVFIRLNEHEGYEQHLKKCFHDKEEYTHILGVKHRGSRGENPHWHILISTQQSIDAVRKRIKLFFKEGKGNAHCSIVPWDGRLPGAGSYLFHEIDVPIVLQKNISEEHITICKENNDRIQVLVQEAKDKASYKLVDRVIDVLKDTPEFDRYINWTKSNIREVMIDVLFETQIHPPTKWQFDAYCNEILMKLYIPAGDKQGYKNQLRLIYRID